MSVFQYGIRISNIMRATEFIIRESMDEDEGFEWEQDLMDTWAPKAARHMARVVKNAFQSLYPQVPIRVWSDNEAINATTDPTAQDPKPDVFGTSGKQDWEAVIFVGPLYHEEDGVAYLDLMVEEAASGQYKGVWKLIAAEWAKYANSQLKRTGAEAVCFSVDEDRNDAWAKIAAQAGLKYIVHN